ncbi:MAG: GNAT family N-acetyltransferase [Tissierellia bacterium]|nr:GNAT family N-acetyltransferase [Tissierellia bacterium]
MRVEKDNIVIRSAVEDDAMYLNRWWNDGDVMEHAGFPKGLNLSLEETIKNIKSWENKLDELCIIEIDGIPIGELNFKIKGDTAYPGWKICEKEYQNIGYGPKVINLLLNFIFSDVDINSLETICEISWDTMAENTRAQYVYEEKIGARKTDLKRNHWKDQLGNWRDTIYYAINREEFYREMSEF